MNAADNKELAKRNEETALALANMFEEETGAGFEEADQNSYAIPFLKVLQSMSKPCKKANSEYVKGAEEGMLFNTVSQALYDGTEGVLFVPAHYTRKFLEWAGTLDEGGGLVAQHNVAIGEEILRSCTRDSDGNDRTPDNHILQDIREHYGLLLDPTTFAVTPVLLSCSSTQIKKSKRFMSLMGSMKRKPEQQAADASYTHVYKITTVPEKKDDFDYFGLKIEHVGGLETVVPPDKQMAVFTAAKSFRDMVKSGQAKAQEPDDVGF